MFFLIFIALAVALLWVGRSHWRLRRSVRLLADAVAQRRSFLHEDRDLAERHPGWRQLVGEVDTILKDLARLRVQGAGQLSQLQTTLGNLREGVLIVDSDNYVLLANPAVRRIFPAAPDAVGHRLERVLHSAAFLDLLDEVRRSGESSQREIEFREQGKLVWVEATGAVVPDTTEPGAPWCLFVLHDITRQKELEALRKEFVANVSHELKTPIAMLKGYAETLSDDDGTMPAEQRVQFARTIHRHAERLAAIVEDLLTLSRLESDRAVIQPIWQAPALLLADAVEEFADALAASRHTLVATGSVEGLEVHVDPMRIGQVLRNLLQNAQKYTPAGSRIELGAKAASGGREVEFWVADNGPGIPPADLPRIFERFYRVEKGRSREKGGTGLGLSIAKHIVQLHGGQIAAESRVGRGTTIHFRLPARAAAANDGPDPTPAHSSIANHPNPTGEIHG